jgi:hypothetical protein
MRAGWFAQAARTGTKVFRIRVLQNCGAAAVQGMRVEIESLEIFTPIDKSPMENYLISFCPILS